MNGNRSRYSTNPTFTMQKRSFFRKPAQPYSEKPDFTAADPASRQPAAPQAPASVSTLGVPPVPPVAELFGTAAPAAAPTGMGTIPSGSIQFTPAPQVPPAQQSGLYGTQSNAPVFMAQPASQNLPPLGNQTLPQQTGMFSQGFTPPQTNAFPAPLLGTGSAAQQTRTAAPAAPTVQPAGFSGLFDAAAAQQPAFGGPAAPRTPAPPAANNRQRIDLETLRKLFLFVLLPVMFVPCLLVPDNFQVLRYLFIALCIAAVAIIWYRNLFKPNTRIAVTLAYSLAAIIVFVMLFQGQNADPQRVQNNPAVQQQAAQTNQNNLNGMPAYDTAAAQPTFTPTPEPEPTPEPISEAQNRLEAFMINWSGARVEDMVRLVQPSWANAQDNPSNRLFVLLGNRTPLSYNIEEITGSDNDSSRTVTMTANIDKNNGKDPTLYRFMVLMVKEGGQWYVDPNSLATNDQVTNKEETNTVNDSQSKAADDWVLPPRQTVTPAPPASQPLYYNPNGGSMYHMDQYCPSVYEQFLPLQGSFPYSELGNHRDKTPCLKCGAPTQTLPPDNVQ